MCLNVQVSSSDYTVPKINLSLRIETQSVRVEADATVHVWFLCQIFCVGPTARHICTVASVPACIVTSSVSMRRFELFLGQCVGRLPQETGSNPTPEKINSRSHE